MKPLGFLIRFITIGIVWSVFFFTFWRSLVYAVWGFDLVFAKHWTFMWQMWQDGWIIDTVPEWLFLMALCLCIPLWVLGWFILLQIKPGKLLVKGAKLLFAKAKSFRKKHLHSRVLVITRRKSYLRVRPPALTYVMPTNDEIRPVKAGRKARAEAKVLETPLPFEDLSENEETASFSEELTSDDANPYETSPAEPMEGEDFYTDRSNSRIPAWDTTPAPKEEAIPLSPEEKADLLAKAKAEVKDVILDHGFDILENVKAGNINVDILALAKGEMLAVVFDAEAGDWLADEESFNGEKPMWFSEEAHRPSPVMEMHKASDYIKKHIGFDDNAKITNLLVIADGKVINADDMLETWDKLGVQVARTAEGMPVNLPFVVKMIPTPDKKATKVFVKECKKVLKSNNEDTD